LSFAINLAVGSGLSATALQVRFAAQAADLAPTDLLGRAKCGDEKGVELIRLGSAFLSVSGC